MSSRFRTIFTMTFPPSSRSTASASSDTSARGPRRAQGSRPVAVGEWPLLGRQAPRANAPWGRGSRSRRLRAPGSCARALPEMPMLRLVDAERSVRPGECPRTDSEEQKTRWGRQGPRCECRSADRSCVRSLAWTGGLSGLDFPVGGSARRLRGREPTEFAWFPGESRSVATSRLSVFTLAQRDRI
jgi:hypothetical protein